ncbi:hypothetical protein OXB_2812 [Bacillus sp. OxB-1]|uniref:hypothetical protein n=1 Tax=Bacillus sp. (strain OxB-1) TaxID=98228 RepID=UPI0005823897|nr:hypothetical protein [Bacillus sp. OxB-1]BAQ11283.1 hypothetical protein OXB_2812 [Bacillus sp. OxB-1]
MNTLIDNYAVIIGLIVLLLVAGSAIFYFFRQPTEAQLRKVRAWLLLAVTQAEKEFGSGMGKIKLRTVYELFITRFTWLARVVSFDMFSDLVDDALEEMREMLKNNPRALEYVNPDGDV